MKNKLSSWKSVSLGNETYFKIMKSGVSYFDGKKEYLSTSSINNTSIEEVESIITYNKRPSRANMQPKLNSVWFAKMKDTLKVYYFDDFNKDEIDQYILSTGFSGIECSEKVDPAFLFQYFTSDKFNMIKNKLAKGSTQKAVSNQEIVSIPVPLPPKKDQLCISQILKTLDNVIYSSESIISKLNLVQKGLSRRILNTGVDHTEFKTTSIGMIPQSWNIRKLGKLLDLCDYGLNDSLSLEGKYPVFRMNNLINGYVVENDLKYLDLDDKNYEKYSLSKGDILFNRTNSYDLVGKVGIYLLDGNHTFASYLIRLRTKKQLNPKFLNYFLNLETTQNTFRRLATRGVSQSNINATSLKSINIPVPPIEEQNEIIKILDIQNENFSKEKSKKIYFEKLKRGLIQDLFSGNKNVRVCDDKTLHRR